MSKQEMTNLDRGEMLFQLTRERQRLKAAVTRILTLENKIRRREIPFSKIRSEVCNVKCFAQLSANNLGAFEAQIKEALSVKSV